MAEKVFEKYHVGLHNVGSYQVSGWPWMTGSHLSAGQEHKLSFPMVAKSVTVTASGSLTGGDEELRVHFASTASGQVVQGHHYFTMENDDDSFTFNVKCKEIYVSAAGAGVGYEILAELTSIPTSSMFTLTGSGLTSAPESSRSDGL